MAGSPSRPSAAAPTSCTTSRRSAGSTRPGTLSGNPVAVTAGLTTLRLADAAVYARVDEVAATVSAAADEAFLAAGVPHVVQRAGSMFSVFLTDGVDGRVDDYDTARTQDEAAFRAFFHAMLDQGVHLPPSAFESWFVSASHDDEAVEVVLAALPGAARAAAAAAAGYAGSAEAAGTPPGEGT